mmetsp:Transcript_59332/g.157965  ORF Transcript_59332/g.157965 Transcript_59332/m.157965 type:complete len:226 (-) Transcript_59332:9-686(-)
MGEVHLHPASLTFATDRARIGASNNSHKPDDQEMSAPSITSAAPPKTLETMSVALLALSPPAATTPQSSSATATVPPAAETWREFRRLFSTSAGRLAGRSVRRTWAPQHAAAKPASPSPAPISTQRRCSRRPAPPDRIQRPNNSLAFQMPFPVMAGNSLMCGGRASSAISRANCSWTQQIVVVHFGNHCNCGVGALRGNRGIVQEVTCVPQHNSHRGNFRQKTKH